MTANKELADEIRKLQDQFKEMEQAILAVSKLVAIHNDLLKNYNNIDDNLIGYQ